MGLASVAAITLGMAATLTGIALAVIAAKRTGRGLARRSEGWIWVFLLEVGGLVLLVAFAFLLVPIGSNSGVASLTASLAMIPIPSVLGRSYSALIAAKICSSVKPCSSTFFEGQVAWQVPQPWQTPLFTLATTLRRMPFLSLISLCSTAP